ncbi:MAG: CDP-diacylglycerol--serine O-phosphatidyltransferase [Campylobacterales bacterium]|nr:CDP-diacylglycerol--serine O-phosphatidyltransferase [Campylobacterales bacterium]
MSENRNFKLIYLLPNIFTAASIFIGVLSIIEASKGNFVIASWYILASLIFDGLDGRVARLTNSTSKFGVEFDSLADVIAFGIAPSMLLYFFIGSQYGKFGIFISAMFVIFGAIRLARFNVTTFLNEPNVFIGLPIPAAAVFITMWVLTFQEYQELNSLAVILLPLSVLVSILMVSNIRYPSFKKVQFQKSATLKLLIIIILICFTLYVFPIEGITILFSIYVLFGLVRAIYNLSKIFYLNSLDKKN